VKVINIHTTTPKNTHHSVLIIYTGGTLGMVYDTSANYLKPFDFEQILEKVPELAQFECRLTVISLTKIIDSSNITPEVWLEIAQIIEENYGLYDGFVILHGTDTMAYSASALSFLLENLGKPVVFTGAQLPIGAIRTDARRNLITAIQIASSAIPHQPIVPEVCILFNDVLLRGNRAKKMETSLFTAFQSENYPNLAEIGINIAYNEAFIRKKPAQKPLKVHQEINQNVAVLKLFPGIRASMVESICQTPHLKGLILETFGSGNAPTALWFIQALRNAIDKGILIYNVSQCIGGRVMQEKYETGKLLQDIGVISGSDISFEAAITKMMFLLGQNLSTKSLKKQLKTSLRGEMT
jgi:L-asparaginase